MPSRPLECRKSPLPLFLAARWFFRTKDPLRCGCSLSISARRARGWPPSRDRPCVVPRGVPTWALGYQAQRAYPILSSRWASPRVRPEELLVEPPGTVLPSRWGSHSGRISTMSARAAPHLGGDGIFVAVGQCGDTVFCDPALGVEGGQRDIIKCWPYMR